MELWKWRKLSEDQTPLDELIRWLNARLTRLSQRMEEYLNAHRGIGDISNGATQPSVYGMKVWRVANPVPVTIVHFRDGEQGQDFYLWSSTGNTTVQNGGTIRTKTGANVVMTANSVMHFVTVDGFNWREV